MKKELNCPLCHEKVYTGLGRGCKLCGMPLEEKNKEFCSKICRIKYNNINKIKIRKLTPILSVIFIFTLVTLISSVSAHTGEDEGIHHEGCGMIGGMMGGYYGLGMGIFGWLIGVLIIVALVLFIIWLVKQIQSPKRKR